VTASNDQSKMKDKELVDFATRFLEAYSASAKSSPTNVTFDKEHRYALGAGGIIELTDEILSAQSSFVHRAAKLLKSKAANEKAISNVVTTHAHEFVAGNGKLETAAANMIKAVFEHGNASFEYLAPNYVIRLNPQVKQIKIGRVRAMLTEEFNKERKSRHPDQRVNIVPGAGFSLSLGQEVTIETKPICWIVDVDAVAENVEEEAKWLIDIALSLLRLSHLNWSSHFPNLGAVEPHPVKPTRAHNEGIKLQGSKVLAGGSSVPPWYEADAAVVGTVQAKKFISQAEIIFDPPEKSLAERVSQGLGWLTRGRQAEDRAERLLYFFTAIEALLSTDDKTAPVVQTIARHAAVLLTNENAARAQVAKALKSLYSVRSSLVHAGNRSILWSGANDAQVLAESLFQTVLESANLKTRHETFCNEVAAASYGTPWPAATSGS
jgi:hypothetical protein